MISSSAPMRGDGRVRVGFVTLARVVLLVLFVFPLLWSALASLKSPAEASQAPPTYLPHTWSFANYQDLFGATGIGRNVVNSLVVALLTVAGTVVLSVLAGYGFARFTFRLRQTLFVMVLAGLMIPIQATIVPLFLMLNRVGLTNSLVGLSLVYITFQLPFSLFVMRNSFAGLPIELEEAARVDGCTSWKLLWRVLLPMARPGVVTVALFAFLNSWNEFFAALIFMNQGETFTLPISLVNAATGQLGTINWGALQAGVVVSMLPCVALYALLQRFYVSGLVSGALK